LIKKIRQYLKVYIPGQWEMFFAMRVMKLISEGKLHLPMQYENAVPWGYNVITKDERDDLARDASDFLLNRKSTDKPFLLFVSFINPHDICYDAIRFGWPESGLAKHTPPDLFDALKMPEGGY